MDVQVFVRLSLTFGLCGLSEENLENPGKLGKSDRNRFTWSEFLLIEICPDPCLSPDNIVLGEYLTAAAVVGRFL